MPPSTAKKNWFQQFQTLKDEVQLSLGAAAVCLAIGSLGLVVHLEKLPLGAFLVIGVFYLMIGLSNLFPLKAKPVAVKAASSPSANSPASPAVRRGG